MVDADGVSSPAFVASLAAWLVAEQPITVALSAGLLCTRSAAGAAFYGCGILVLSVQGVVSLALSTRFYAAHEIRLPWTPTLLVDAPLLLTAIGCFVPLGVDVYEAAH